MKICCYCGKEIALDTSRYPSCVSALPQSEILPREILTEVDESINLSRKTLLIGVLLIGSALVFCS